MLIKFVQRLSGFHNDRKRSEFSLEMVTIIRGKFQIFLLQQTVLFLDKQLIKKFLLHNARDGVKAD